MQRRATVGLVQRRFGAMAAVRNPYAINIIFACLLLFQKLVVLS